MVTQKKSESCNTGLCDSTADLIEKLFCELVSKAGVEPTRCKRLMERKRKREISYPQLLEGLGLDDATFDRHLDIALRKAERIVKPKKRV